MSERPISDRFLTEPELTALHGLGYDWFTTYNHDTNIAQAYRAGFRDGSKANQPRVFRHGDPEPDDVQALTSHDGFYFIHRNEDPDCGEHRWRQGCRIWTWDQVMDRGPLVEVLVPDWKAAIEADHARMIAAGGAR